MAHTHKTAKTGSAGKAGHGETTAARGGLASILERMGIRRRDVKTFVPETDGAPGWKPAVFTVDTRGLVANEREQYKVGAGFRELVNNVFDAGGTQCDIVIDHETNTVFITGNGTPIRSVEELQTLFASRKRDTKIIKDITGQTRVIIGEKGRGRLATSVDCEEAVWISEFGEFKLDFRQQGDLTIAVRDKPTRRVEEGKTVVAMKRTKGNPYDEKSIREFLEKTYRHFGGLNFTIRLNGQEIPMQEFKPTERFIACAAPASGKKPPAMPFSGEWLESKYGYPYCVYRVSGRVSDDRLAEFASETPNAHVVSISHAPAQEPKEERVQLLAQRIPVTAGHGWNIIGSFIVDSGITVTPARDNFAEWRDEQGAVICSDTPRLLDRLVSRAFVLYLNSGKYTEHGWNELENPKYHSVLAFARWYVESPLVVPDVQAIAYVPERGGIAKRVVTTVGKIADSGKEIVVIGNREVTAAALTGHVHRGAIIVVTENDDGIKVLLEGCGAKKVHDKDSPVTRGVASRLESQHFIVDATAEEKEALDKLEVLGNKFSVRVGVAEFTGTLDTNTKSVAYANGRVCLVRDSPLYKELLKPETASRDQRFFELTIASEFIEASAEKQFQETPQTEDKPTTREQIALELYARFIELLRAELYAEPTRAARTRAKPPAAKTRKR